MASNSLSPSLPTAKSLFPEISTTLLQNSSLMKLGWNWGWVIIDESRSAWAAEFWDCSKAGPINASTIPSASLPSASAIGLGSASNSISVVRMSTA